jgi:hypothetical protein
LVTSSQSRADIQSDERTVMSKVFVNIGLSLDGYMAPEGMTMEHWDKVPGARPAL